MDDIKDIKMGVALAYTALGHMELMPDAIPDHDLEAVAASLEKDAASLRALKSD